MLRATTACTFSCLIWPAGSAPAASEPTFRPSGATNHWKNTVNRDFPIFSRIYLFFLLILSLLTLLTSAFQLSILSEVSLLNFLRIYIYIYIPSSSYLFVVGVFCTFDASQLRKSKNSSKQVCYMLDSTRWHDPLDEYLYR